MAKVNVNKATREELIEVGGVRANVAEAILKARDEQQGHKFADFASLKEALKDAKGVGAVTLDQLEDTFEYTAAAAKQVAEKTAETAEKTADVAASTAKAGADATRRTVEKTAEVTSIATRAGAEQAQRLATTIADTEKAVAEKSTTAATDLGQLVVGLFNEQMQANVETIQALARVRSLRDAIEVQNGYVRGNIQRATSGASRYMETVTRLMTGMAAVGRAQAKKAA